MPDMLFHYFSLIIFFLLNNLGIKLRGKGRGKELVPHETGR